MSHPMRVRGLKCTSSDNYPPSFCVAPHAGAWIEMAVCVWMPEATGSHPMRVRGLK